MATATSIEGLQRLPGETDAQFNLRYAATLQAFNTGQEVQFTYGSSGARTPYPTNTVSTSTVEPSANSPTPVSRSATNKFASGSSKGAGAFDPAYMIHFVAPRDRGETIIVSALLPENFTSTVTSDYDTPFAEGMVQNENLKLAFRLAGAPTTTQMMSMQVWQNSAPMDFNIPLNFILNTDTEKDILKPLRDLMSLTLPSVASSNPLDQLPVINRGGTISGTGALLNSPGPKLRLRSGETPKSMASRILGIDAIKPGAKLVGDVFDIGDQNTDTTVNTFSTDAQSFINSLNLFDKFEVYDNISVMLGQFFYLPSVVITDVSQDFEIKLDRYTKRPIALQATVGFRTFVTPKAEDLYSMIPRA